uniref:Reverse transcriptase domain-containing protein n=1 Tax=Amphiprion percula TaxID=161767 RepID=A0A3P8SQG9_AMPPE
MEKEKILERWSQYIEELFEDDRKGKPSISKSIDGPKILKSEVRAAMHKMKKNKAAGPDGITVEQLTALDEFGIDKVTEIMNQIYDSGEIPEDMEKSIFIALPKKPGAIDCELHRTISLMSHMTKILLPTHLKHPASSSGTRDTRRKDTERNRVNVMQ